MDACALAIVGAASAAADVAAAPLRNFRRVVAFNALSLLMSLPPFADQGCVASTSVEPCRCRLTPATLNLFRAFGGLQVWSNARRPAMAALSRNQLLNGRPHPA